MTGLPVRRRTLLAAGAAASLARPAAAQRPAAGQPFAIAQLYDASVAEQDVSKDFLIGARAAWQDLNARGGVRGRGVQHLAVEVDRSAGSLERAWPSVRDNPACVALSGTVSDPLARQLAEVLQKEDVPIAHAAPWLQEALLQVDERTFPIFAGRAEQIAHALRSLAISGMSEVGAVFASARDAQLYRGEVERAAAALKLKLARWTAEGSLAQLGQRLGPATPAVLLFIGGTPELVQFTQGLERQARQRYVVALADVNLQTVAQMGGGRSTPVIATQVVPVVTAALPVVRHYRDVLSRLFDEPPTALGLAGFIAAQFTIDVLQDVDGTPTRASVLAAFQRRRERDLGGFLVRFDAQRRSAAFVTQSMLTSDGRVVG
jgi:ABC-type branched-subunit amino acid transport system substrate-binding protein